MGLRGALLWITAIVFAFLVAFIAFPRTGDAAAERLKRRNEWVCGPSDELLAVWDGSRGGTSSCVNFWRRCGQHEILIDPRDLW